MKRENSNQAFEMKRDDKDYKKMKRDDKDYKKMKKMKRDDKDYKKMKRDDKSAELYDRIDQLIEERTELYGRINRLTEQNTDLKMDVMKESKCAYQAEHLANTLKRKNNDQHGRLIACNNDYIHMQRMMDRLRTECQALKAENTEHRVFRHSLETAIADVTSHF